MEEKLILIYCRQFKIVSKLDGTKSDFQAFIAKFSIGRNFIIIHFDCTYNESCENDDIVLVQLSINYRLTQKASLTLPLPQRYDSLLFF